MFSLWATVHLHLIPRQLQVSAIAINFPHEIYVEIDYLNFVFAAAAAQCQVVYKNLSEIIEGRRPVINYDGYASCPLVTGYHTCILAEFDYDLQPMETFNFLNQAKERYSMFFLKRDAMPQLYWHMMLNGIWNGPAALRNSIKAIRNFF